ncbi:hypothetical protein [Oleiagrimonas sp. C23AA]|uniref:hypothetical protein n=1 Tax=Oleiagrimonas sp. C23AA TaxID=2719047 RepID=UPI0014239FD5|nr:hypothetical protein [Oleiagrimonas sp. C23AA]NII11068.1 hypothetical protein [Oleiagrimonas sp. C23AA]
MPLLEADENDVKRQLLSMFMDTIETFRAISQHAELYFGEHSEQLSRAIDEYIRDFIEQPDGEERIHPEVLIFRTDRVALQSTGFYGAQLAVKERQVTQANRGLREVISGGVRSVFRRPFKKWVGIINNFLGSLGITGIGSALKEIKDCLRDELPDD